LTLISILILPIQWIEPVFHWVYNLHLIKCLFINCIGHECTIFSQVSTDYLPTSLCYCSCY
jgi:hypothetical protein